MLARVVSAETLDHLAPDHPAAIRSRRDLVRVHQAMGTRTIICRAWQRLMSTARSGTPLRILELGAGDGRLLLGVARSLANRWPPVQLSLLDRQNIVTPSTLAGFEELGWSATVQVADALDWAVHPRDEAMGTSAAQWDLITTALFLHHFSVAELDLLLGAVASCSDRFFACEPQRSWLGLAGSHLVWALGANAVTREDAVLSVHAGFQGSEISARWPKAAGPWQVRECAAGLFSHCFSAQRPRVSL